MENRLKLLGNWPLPGKIERAKKEMIVIKSENTLDFIHGSKNHMLISFAVSNDYIHFGSVTIPSGVCSDKEVHEGDEVLYVLKGTVSVVCANSSETGSVTKSRHEVNQGEHFLIPENTVHRYFNLTNNLTKIIFAIAPKL